VKVACSDIEFAAAAAAGAGFAGVAFVRTTNSKTNVFGPAYIDKTM
jgi:hypothetical protein